MKNVVNIKDAPEKPYERGAYQSFDRDLTPVMAPRTGRLGVQATRIPPGKSGCPFHTHLKEDEVFFVLSGRGVLRYGEALQEIGPGDCITCPAGSGIAHQIANIFDEDLIYLSIGGNEPHEVCTYPDSGKVNIVGLKQIGMLTQTDYYAGEPETPRIFGLAEELKKNEN